VFGFTDTENGICTQCRETAKFVYEMLIQGAYNSVIKIEVND
jgi:hypothetical protein